MLSENITLGLFAFVLPSMILCHCYFWVELTASKTCYHGQANLVYDIMWCFQCFPYLHPDSTVHTHCVPTAWHQWNPPFLESADITESRPSYSHCVQATWGHILSFLIQYVLRIWTYMQQQHSYSIVSFTILNISSNLSMKNLLGCFSCLFFCFRLFQCSIFSLQVLEMLLYTQLLWELFQLLEISCLLPCVSLCSSTCKSISSSPEVVGDHHLLLDVSGNAKVVRAP